MAVGELPTTGPAHDWIRAPQHGGPDSCSGRPPGRRPRNLGWPWKILASSSA